MSAIHGACVLAVPAELDVYTAPTFREAVVEAENTGYYHLVADLSGTDVVDVTGIGALVGALNRCTKHGGWLRLACAHGQVLRALRLAGLHRVFVLADNVEDAINYETEGATP